MKINKRKLQWSNGCCGCNNIIPKNEITYILSNIIGVNGTIHLCEKCISEICYVVNDDSVL